MKKNLFFTISLFLFLGLNLSSSAQYCTGGPTSTFDSDLNQFSLLHDGGTYAFVNDCIAPTIGVETITGVSATLD